MPDGHVAVLGGGPAGLMAAWAAVERGWTPHIFDIKGKGAITSLLDGKVQAGVFLLHEECGLVSVPRREVRYAVAGMGFSIAELAEMYAKKVYGKPEMAEQVSVTNYLTTTVREEWDGLEAVRHLAHMLEHRYAPAREIVRSDLQDMLHPAGGAMQRVISTVPLPSLYKHHPLNEDIWPHVEVQLHVGTGNPEESWVHYIPVPGVPFYRVSAVFGRFVAEYPGWGLSPPAENATVTVRKPLRPPRGVAEEMAALEATGKVLFAGRFGRWQKGVEQHHVYQEVSEWLAD